MRTLALIAAAGLAGVPGAQVVAQQADGVAVTITVTNIRNDDGVVRACMTADEDEFPRCQDNPDAHRAVVDASEEGVTFRFYNVQPGRYAIALLHDEDDDGKMDRALGMMPTEGYGFSRDARVTTGPPRFSSAAIDIGSEPLSQSIRMRYWL